MSAPDTPCLLALSPRDRADLLCEEYRALYTLVRFRMTSLERRIPAVGATLAVFLGSIAVLPPESRDVFLIGLPIAVVWFVRTTVNHARSFEDVLRRLEELEGEINGIANERLLKFQSTHPSRQRRVGGRTGSETVMAVLWGSVSLLLGCAYLAHAHFAPQQWLFESYWVFLLAVAAYLALVAWRLGRYRYGRQPQIQTDPSSRSGEGR